MTCSKAAKAHALLISGLLLVGTVACGASTPGDEEPSGTTQGSGGGTTQGSSGDSHYSRVRSYADLESLATSSAVVVAGTAVKQNVAADITPSLDFTLTELKIGEVVSGVLPQGATKITIRQVGSPTQAPAVPLLVPGEQYLLFLKRSGLPGELAEQFYVTGVGAGLYQAAGESPPALLVAEAVAESTVTPEAAFDWSTLVFEEVAPDDVDNLPDTLSTIEVPTRPKVN